MKQLIIITLLLTLSGCATYHTVIAERGAEASDAALESVVWTLCNATPVGAVRRKFTTTELQSAYNTICATAAPLP